MKPETIETGFAGTNAAANSTNSAQQPPKPNNNLVLAIITTVCCCLPLGIVAIVKACNVNSLYATGQYDEAELAAQAAKKWSIIGIVASLVIWVIYVLFFAGAGLFAAGAL